MQAEIQKLRKKYGKDNSIKDVVAKPQQLQPLVINSHSPDLTNKGMK